LSVLSGLSAALSVPRERLETCVQLHVPISRFVCFRSYSFVFTVKRLVCLSECPNRGRCNIVIAQDCQHIEHMINNSFVMFSGACVAASSGLALSLSSSASDLVEFSSELVAFIEASGRAGLLVSSEPCVV
jgi:hypothetical protein